MHSFVDSVKFKRLKILKNDIQNVDHLRACKKEFTNREYCF